MHRERGWGFRSGIVALAVLWTAVSATAQDFGGLGGSPLANPLGGQLGFGEAPEKEITVTGRLRAFEGTTTGVVEIEATVIPGWHTYSMTTADGGPLKTEISLATAGVTLSGGWRSNVDPEVKEKDETFGVRVEKFHDRVIWSAPVSWEPSFDPATTALQVKINGQVCTDDIGQCVNYDETVTATFTGFEAAPSAPAAGDFRLEKTHALWSGKVTPSVAKPGDEVRIEITGTPVEDHYLYAYAERAEKGSISAATLFAMTRRGGWAVDRPTVSVAPKTKETGVPKQPTVEVHTEPVTWTLRLRVPEGATAGVVPLEGAIGFQTCSETGCDMPAGLKFAVDVQVGESTGTESAPVSFVAFETDGDPYEAVAAAVEKTTWGGVDPQAAPPAEPASLGTILYWAGISFIAGLILNVMPCVLPVIGLKIMSLVSQAGASRLQIFLLNFWLSVGIVSVFLILATLAVVFGMGWSDQFTNPWFVVTLTAVVFTFGLSFLGVWEVPIPGLSGSSGAAKLAEREGAIGAFFKGVLSTVLATPCAGPMMVPAITFAVSQPPAIAYAMFGSMGLGMASPYLLIGLVPSTIRWLPRPGDWMVTFKELMGFAMLATVVFLFSILQDEMQLPMAALLVILGFGCWWIGRVPLTESQGTRLKAWGTSAAVVALGAWGSFQLLGPQKGELEWQPYDQAALQKHLSEGRVVFLDFTADWCFTCKVNERTALNIEETRELFDKLGIVPMKADKTVARPDIDQLLAELGNAKAAIPVYAVFTPEGERVVFDGMITHGTVKAKLAEAGVL